MMLRRGGTTNRDCNTLRDLVAGTRMAKEDGSCDSRESWLMRVSDAVGNGVSGRHHDMKILCNHGAVCDRGTMSFTFCHPRP
ncbi:hypothetical protein SESBI_50957 [Sesbania bispinosa]|nr:hypothetical protein SESBI_50957 [Sesbania bispinosa]